MTRKDWPNKQEKLEDLADDYGWTVGELLAEGNFDGTAPGICMRQGCRFIEDYESDQEEGWCPKCETNTVCSALVLAELI